MAYRIISIERIDGESLPTPLPPGIARFKALVEMWDGDAVGPPHVVDEFILQRPTQFMRPAGGDDWELASKQESLTEHLTKLIEAHEDHYGEQIRAGARGFLGDAREERHGLVTPNDAIAHHADVKKLIGSVRGKRRR